MNTKLTSKLLIPVLVLLIAGSLISTGCQEKRGQPPPAPSVADLLSATLVPNVPLDIYIYSRQESPTAIPLEIVGVTHPVEVEALALWGITAEEDIAFGAALTLTSTDEASGVYAWIEPEEHVWKMLSGNTVYIVRNLVARPGTAMASLKAAISNNDFKYYDDEKSLKAAATLPNSGTAKLAAVALAEPDAYLTHYISAPLQAARIDVVAAGLYSSGHIDLAKMVEAMRAEDSMPDLDLGMLFVVQSGLPGLVVSPIIKKLLTESEFVEANVGGLTLYKRYETLHGARRTPVLVRVEGNHIFAAVSGQESYAQTLITSVNR